MTARGRRPPSAVSGLQREFTPGSSNQIYVPVEDCLALMAQITDLAHERDCPVARAYGESISMVCQGERNEMIGIVGQAINSCPSDVSGSALRLKLELQHFHTG